MLSRSDTADTAISAGLQLLSTEVGFEEDIVVVGVTLSAEEVVVGVRLPAGEVVVGVRLSAVEGGEAGTNEVVMPAMGVSILLLVEEDDTVVGVTLPAEEMAVGVRLSAVEGGGAVLGTGLSAVEEGGVGPNEMVMSVMGVSILLVGEGSLAIVETIIIKMKVLKTQLTWDRKRRWLCIKQCDLSYMDPFNLWMGVKGHHNVPGLVLCCCVLERNPYRQ